jgi:hypothetical protein
MSPDTPLLLLPSNRHGSGRLELRIEAASVLDGPGIEHISDIVHVLSKGASHGAFPAPGVEPASAYLRIGKTGVEESRVLVFEVDGDGYDWRGFQLLRSMSERLLRYDIKVLRVALSSSSAPWDEVPTPLPTDETEYDAYPAMSSLIRFQTIREPLDDGKSRRAIVDLFTEVDKSQLQRLDVCLRPWFHLLEAGAFALPVGLPSETESIAGAVTLFDAQSIEVSINCFQASECAWNAFVNMVDACWADMRFVSHVTIE